MSIDQVVDVWIGDSGATSYITHVMQALCTNLGHHLPTDKESSWVMDSSRMFR